METGPMWCVGGYLDGQVDLVKRFIMKMADSLN